MESKLKLSTKNIAVLTTLPENGMGYHIVDLILKNGLVLKERIVLNSTYLKLNETENINVSDISKVEVHKKHNSFK